MSIFLSCSNTVPNYSDSGIITACLDAKDKGPFDNFGLKAVSRWFKKAGQRAHHDSVERNARITL